MRTLHGHPAAHAAPAPRRQAMAVWRQPALGLACALAPGASQAHVKWFSTEADCRVPPLPALHVLAGTEFFACQAACPHTDVPLADGIHDGKVLTCLEHMWQFDLRTGAALGDAEAPVTTYRTKEENGELYVWIEP